MIKRKRGDILLVQKVKYEMETSQKIYNLNDLSARLREEGLPSSRTTIIRYEKTGVVTLVRRHPCGARYYFKDDIEEIVKQVRANRPTSSKNS